MDGAGGDKVHVTLLHLFEGKESLNSTVGNSLGKLVLITLALKSHIESRALICLDNVPHLGLAKLSLVLKRVAVGWVHLYRELFSGIDEFSQNRESVEFIRKCTPRTTWESLGHLGAVGYLRLAALGKGKLPALGNPVFLGFLTVASQFVAAPKVILNGGCKLIYLVHILYLSFFLLFYHFA